MHRLVGACSTGGVVMGVVVSVSDKLDTKAQSWRISFRKTLLENETAFATVTEPETLIATAQSIDVADALAGSSIAGSVGLKLAASVRGRWRLKATLRQIYWFSGRSGGKIACSRLGAFRRCQFEEHRGIGEFEVGGRGPVFEAATHSGRNFHEQSFLVRRLRHHIRSRRAIKGRDRCGHPVYDRRAADILA